MITTEDREAMAKRIRILLLMVLIIIAILMIIFINFFEKSNPSQNTPTPTSTRFEEEAGNCLLLHFATTFLSLRIFPLEINN